MFFIWIVVDSKVKTYYLEDEFKGKRNIKLKNEKENFIDIDVYADSFNC